MTQGRKPINNQEILSEIVSDPEALKEFKGGIEEIENALVVLGGAQGTVKDVIAAVADKTSLSKGFLKKVALARLGGGAQDILEEAESLVEILSVAFGDEEAPF